MSRWFQTGKLQFVRPPIVRRSQRGSNVNTWVPTQMEKSPEFRRSPAGIFKLNSDLYLLYEIYIVEINGEYLRVAWDVTIFCVLKSQKIKFLHDFRTLSRKVIKNFTSKLRWILRKQKFSFCEIVTQISFANKFL